MVAPTLLRCHFRPQLPLYLTAKPLPQCGATLQSKQGWNLHPAQAWASTWVVMGNQPVTGAVFYSPSLPCFEKKQACMCSSWAESRLSTVLLLAPLALQPAKVPHVSCVWPQGWGSHYVAQTTHSPGRISTCVIALFLWVPSKGYSSRPSCLFYLSTWFPMDLSYRLGYTGVFLTVPT